MLSVGKFLSRANIKYRDSIFNISEEKKSMDKVFLGKAIREQRLLKKMPSSELAERVGISRTHLSQIESGHKAPRMETFIKIVNVLEVPADVFIRDQVEGGKSYILNEITHKMRDLPPAQLVKVADLVNGIIYLLKPSDE